MVSSVSSWHLFSNLGQLATKMRAIFEEPTASAHAAEMFTDKLDG